MAEARNGVTIRWQWIWKSLLWLKICTSLVEFTKCLKLIYAPEDASDP
jgi:hypothetical protein